MVELPNLPASIRCTCWELKWRKEGMWFIHCARGAQDGGGKVSTMSQSEGAQWTTKLFCFLFFLLVIKVSPPWHVLFPSLSLLTYLIHMLVLFFFHTHPWVAESMLDQINFHSHGPEEAASTRTKPLCGRTHVSVHRHKLSRRWLVILRCSSALCHFHKFQALLSLLLPFCFFSHSYRTKTQRPVE